MPRKKLSREEQQKLIEKNVWTTKKVNEAVEEQMQTGDSTIPSCFWGQDPRFRAANIHFEMTAEETSEFIKCSKDIHYFAEKYCKILTDNGVDNIELRDYQRKMLKTFNEEQFSILVASRQIGKCSIFNTKITIHDKSIDELYETNIGDLYFSILKSKRKLTWREKLKWRLWKYYNKSQKLKEKYQDDSNAKFISNKLEKWLISKIEKIEKTEYKKYSLDEEDPTKKIMDTINIYNMDIYVKTDTGLTKISDIHKTQPFKIIKIATDSGKILECADKHIIFDEYMQEIFCADLKFGDKIQTIDGVERIASIEIIDNKVSMFDITVHDNNHRYWTNGILSHNTITIGMFIAWYLCFNFDKNVLVLANKQVTTIEIIDKIKNIIHNLPFFLQPGVLGGGKTGLTFDNDNRIFSQSTTKSAAIGFTVHLLFADEFAHINSNFINDFYRSIYPTLSSSKVSKIIICSTPNGPNLFYRLYKNAVNGNNSYVPLKVDWWEVPGRDEKWKAREIANLGSEEMFEQEFGNKFIISSSTLLEAQATEFFARIVEDYIWKDIDSIDSTDEIWKNLIWHPDFNPNDIYDDEKFTLTIDLADGVGRDYSVINIFKLEPLSIAKIRKIKNKENYNETDFFRLRQVGKFSSNNIPITKFSEILSTILFDIFIPDILSVVMEMNFKGSYVLEHIKEHESYYPEFFIHTHHNVRTNKMKIGVVMGKENKQLFCRKHKDRTKNGQLIITDVDTFDQLQTFSIDSSGKYQSNGSNDDSAITSILTEAYFDSTNFIDDVNELVYNIDQKTQIEIFNKMTIENDGLNKETMSILKSLNT